MTSTSGQVRASGRTQAEEVAEEIFENLDDDATAEIEKEVTEEAKAKWRTPGFARIRVDWLGNEGDVVQRVQRDVEDRVRNYYLDAYEILSDIYDLVREPERDINGQEVRDPHTGFIVWRRSPTGSYVEDWNKLTKTEAKDYMFRISTRQFEWRQRAANAWGEAMFAKAQWEERFSIAYNAPLRDTIDGRTAHGRVEAADERYFAIFVTLFSKKCDALVETMDRLAARMESFLRY